MGSLNARAYSRAAVTLHWLVAAALLMQMALGWAMTWREPPSFAAFQVHKTIGLTILLLTLARVAVRLLRPPARAAEVGWQGQLAAATHFALYAYMIAAPLTGWLLVSSAAVRVPTWFFGIIPWPHLPVGGGWAATAEEAHELIAWAGAGLILLHLAGALRHHLILRDTTLRRMLPERVPGDAVAVAAAGLLVLGASLPAWLGTTAPRASAAPVPSASIESNAPAATNDIDAAPASERLVATETSGNLAAPVGEIAEEAAAGPVDWKIQPRGTLSISVGIDGGSVAGSFTDWSGTIRFDPETAEGAIRIAVKTGSLKLGDASQDSMATGDGYLESAKFPVATFTANRFTKLSANRYRANGTLELKGAKRPLVVTFTLAGSGDRRTADGTADIARAAFGIGGGDDGFGIAPVVSVSFRFDARSKS